MRSARPVSSPVAARPTAPQLPARAIVVGPLGDVHTASARLGLTARVAALDDLTLIDRFLPGFGAIDTTGIALRLFTGDGQVLHVRVPAPGNPPSLAAQLMLTSAVPAVVPSTGLRGSPAPLLTRWTGWLGREVVRFVLDQVAFVADPHQPLAVRVEYDTRTGKPKEAHFAGRDDITTTAAATVTDRATVMVSVNLAAEVPTIEGVRGAAQSEFQSLFAMLPGTQLIFPSAGALQAMGVTNALMRTNLSFEPPIVTGAAGLVANAQPTLTLAAAPDHALLTGFAWTWPDGHRRIGGAPWIGEQFGIRHTIVTTPAGKLARVPLPLELQPFWGNIDPRALSLLATEYFAQRRPRHHGYGTDGDVAVQVFGS